MAQRKRNYHVRWMIRKDMPAVLSIERCQFEFPWSEEDFRRCLNKRNCIGKVAEHYDQVVGFVIYELHKTRLHIWNLATACDFVRRGVGTALIRELAKNLTDRRPRILCEVRETNLRAQQFFKAQGFRAVETLRGFYEAAETTEDAYLFQYRVGEPAGILTADVR